MQSCQGKYLKGETLVRSILEQGRPLRRNKINNLCGKNKDFQKGQRRKAVALIQDTQEMGFAVRMLDSHNQTRRGAASALLGRLERMEQVMALPICSLTCTSGIIPLKDQESGIQTPNTTWTSITGALRISSCLGNNSNKEGRKCVGGKI